MKTFVITWVEFQTTPPAYPYVKIREMVSQSMPEDVAIHAIENHLKGGFDPKLEKFIEDNRISAIRFIANAQVGMHSDFFTISIERTE